MKPFQAAFVPSKWRKVALLTMSVATMCAVLVFHFGAMRWALAILTGICTMWSWRESPYFVHQMWVDKQTVYLLIQQQKVSAHLLSGSLVSRYVCCLRWQCGKRVIWQWIFPDMLPENDFRRMRVWAKWCQY